MRDPITGRPRLFLGGCCPPDYHTCVVQDTEQPISPEDAGWAVFDFAARWYDGMWDPLYRVLCGTLYFGDLDYVAHERDKAEQAYDPADDTDDSWWLTLMALEDDLRCIRALEAQTLCRGDHERRAPLPLPECTLGSTEQPCTGGECTDWPLETARAQYRAWQEAFPEHAAYFKGHVPHTLENGEQR